MIIRNIPTSSDPFYTQTTTLSGVTYVLYFQYLQRTESWYLTISDLDGNALASGLHLVANFSLLGALQNPALPPGDLIVLDLSDDGTAPGIDELGEGKRCQLVYVTAGVDTDE